MLESGGRSGSVHHIEAVAAVQAPEQVPGKRHRPFADALDKRHILMPRGGSGSRWRCPTGGADQRLSRPQRRLYRRAFGHHRAGRTPRGVFVRT
jgi:hypothetical protein